jgi:hypothetical protein
MSRTINVYSSTRSYSVPLDVSPIEPYSTIPHPSPKYTCKGGRCRIDRRATTRAAKLAGFDADHEHLDGVRHGFRTSLLMAIGKQRYLAPTRVNQVGRMVRVMGELRFAGVDWASEMLVAPCGLDQRWDRQARTGVFSGHLL